MGRTAEVGSASNAGSFYDGRTLDVVVATLLLILVLPLMGLCALAVLATSRGPIFFRHPRIGRHGELFTCLKFRTMVQEADTAIEHVLRKSTETRQEWEALQKLRRDPRVTPVGAFLRRYCLDELPQLINVLAGEMSIVGPRPIVASELERYGVNFAAYCSVKPGLTGLWQVSGRHFLSYDERVELDAEYARSKTLSLDLLILWRTVPIVLRGENV
jgi:lipopolysaccharide/colanic/teichoic acid biosynthesis glycosyltransferase